MTDLRAALVLSLNDQLSAGLGKLKRQMDQIRSVGQRLTLGKLELGTQQMVAATRAARGFHRAIGGIGAAADAAWGKIKRMGGALPSRLQHMWRGDAVVSKRGVPTGKFKGGLKDDLAPAMHGGALGGVLGVASVIEPMRANADFNATLRQIAIVEGRSGGGQADRLVSHLRSRFGRLALRSGQSSSDIAEAYKWIITTHPGATPAASRAMADQMVVALARAATAYHMKITDLSNIPFSLQSGFGLRGDQMETGLAVLHRAAMQAHFTMQAFDQNLAGLGAQFGSFGLSGVGGLKTLAAMLETVVKVVPSATPSSAATGIGELLTYVTTPTGQARLAMTSKGFAGKMYASTRAMLARAGITHGVDVPALIHNAALKGIDPVNAVLNWLHKKLLAIPKTITGLDRKTLEGQVINAFLGSNREAAQAARGILLHWDDYHRNQQAIGAAGQGSFEKNFQTMFKSSSVQLNLMNERLRQLNRTIGADFVPLLQPMIAGLQGIGAALKWMGPVGRWLVLIVGATALAVGALGLLGAVAPAVAAGFMLLLSAVGGVASAIAALAFPFAAVALVIGGAAWDIYAHWANFRPFFVGMGTGVMDVLDGLGNFIAGVFTLNLTRAIGGIGQVFSGLNRIVNGIFGVLKRLFMDLIEWLMGWSDKQLKGVMERIAADLEAPFKWAANELGMKPVHVTAGGTHSASGGTAGGMGYLMPSWTPAAPAAPAHAAPAQHHVLISFDPLTGAASLRHAPGSDPGGVSLGPDVGHTLARP